MRGDLSRAVTRMTLDLHRRIDARKDAELRGSFCERQQQFQFPFNGDVGMFPVEATFKILFDIVFAQDAGVARDSQLGEPHIHHGFRLLSGPDGTIPYLHVPSWIQDDDFNFIGANVTMGVHNPNFTQNAQAESVPFTGILHISFQGYGAPIDPAGDGPDGGFPYGVEGG